MRKLVQFPKRYKLPFYIKRQKGLYLLSLVLLSVHLLVDGSTSAEAAARYGMDRDFPLSSRPGRTVLPAAGANAAAFGTSRWRYKWYYFKFK